MNNDVRFRGLISDYKEKRKIKEEAYAHFEKVSAEWDRQVWNNPQCDADLETRLSKELDCARVAYEQAKKELLFYADFAMSYMIKEFDL